MIWIHLVGDRRFMWPDHRHKAETNIVENTQVSAVAKALRRAHHVVRKRGRSV